MTDPPPLHFSSDALEAMARQLEASGRYKILRQFERNTLAIPVNVATLRWGVYLDTETTGLVAARDEIIELAMVPFQYDEAGQIVFVGQPWVRLRQPSVPIPPEITRVTGITDAMVAGHTIDPAEVAAYVAGAVIVVAHNAAFDRPFVERFCEAFKLKSWACSMREVDWAGHGFEGTKLSYLAAQAGFFFTGHRAENDCLAGIEILSRTLSSGQTALRHMLEAARATTWRIAAVNAPYHHKDTLKARGYRWNDGGNLSPKAWWIDVAEHAYSAEMTYLVQEIYGYDPQLSPKRITAFERFSERA